MVRHSKSDVGNAEVVVWLTPVERQAEVTLGPAARLLQKDKRFSPHLLAITVGTEIEFPNRDPFFHDVFSIYHGKPFDLGLYESGASRKVRFSKPGISYIFCNIHPEMSAVVVALSTPYFATSARDGSFQIAHVPPGRYKLEIWHELVDKGELASLTREFEVGSADSLVPTIALHASEISSEHLNKYGESYAPEKRSKY